MIHQQISRRRPGVAVAWLAALGIACLGAAPASAQGVLAPGNAAVTGFSGAIPPAQLAPGVDPATQTFIDLDGPSLRIVDLQQMGGRANAQLVPAAKISTVRASDIGQVFAVALDDATPRNIYVAASSAYGLAIVAPGPDGRTAHIAAGAPGASFMPGQWGSPGGGPGSIWKISGETGIVTLFATVTLDGRSNSGAALGGLAFDPVAHALFVADRETGMIHRLGMDGAELGRFDHGVQGRVALRMPPAPFDPARSLDITGSDFDSRDPATWRYAPPARRVFGLGVLGRRLYYAVAQDLQVWSVGLRPDGSFNDDVTIEIAVPPAAGPTEISKITFDEQGRMFLAERPAPTGAFDFAALTPEGIGRVLRYARRPADSARPRNWQPEPDLYAIGFALSLRNGNGGVAIGYRYDNRGRLEQKSCGGLLWATGEQLRRSSNPGIATQLAKSGAAGVDGLQGTETWLIQRRDEPPWASYFIDYDDRFDEDDARGHLGDVAIWRTCETAPRVTLRRPPLPGRGRPSSSPPGTPAGGSSPGTPGTPPGGTCQPGSPNCPPSGGTCQPGSPNCPPSGGICPPGSPNCPSGVIPCPPGTSVDPNTGQCLSTSIPGNQCTPPDTMVGGQCCSPDALKPGGACASIVCPPGQTPVGSSNFCCNSSQVYTDASGAQACCLSGQPVNGQCQPPSPPGCAPGSNNPPCCQQGYVLSGNSCCLATQLTSTGVCCPGGQKPGGWHNSRCQPVPSAPQCCAAGLIPAGDGSCCAASNVTSTGICCPTPVDPRNRKSCPVHVTRPPSATCAKGYTAMPDRSCCANRYVGEDGKSCNPPPPVCDRGEVRLPNGQCCERGSVRGDRCVPPPPVPLPVPVCDAHQVRLPNGQCCERGSVRGDRCVPPPPVPVPVCDAGQVRLPNGQCCRFANVRGDRCVSTTPVPAPPPVCDAGQVRLPNGRCCNRGSVRGGICVVGTPPPDACGRGEVRLANGQCCSRRNVWGGRCRATPGAANVCGPGAVRLANGQCCSRANVRNGRCGSVPHPPKVCPTGTIKRNGDCVRRATPVVRQPPKPPRATRPRWSFPNHTVPRPQWHLR